jgi:hypothetical protein
MATGHGPAEATVTVDRDVEGHVEAGARHLRVVDTQRDCAVG